MPVLKPEIKNIAEDKKGVRVVHDGVEPTNYFFFSLEADTMRGGTQVKIGSEINSFIFRDGQGQINHDLQNMNSPAR